MKKRINCLVFGNITDEKPVWDAIITDVTFSISKLNRKEIEVSILRSVRGKDSKVYLSTCKRGQIKHHKEYDFVSDNNAYRFYKIEGEEK